MKKETKISTLQRYKVTTKRQKKYTEEPRQPENMVVSFKLQKSTAKVKKQGLLTFN